MIKRGKLKLLKGIIGVFAFLLISQCYVTKVRADEVSNYPGTDVQSVDTNTEADIDWDAIMSTLSEQSINDGDKLYVDDQYYLEIEVVINPVAQTNRAMLASSYTNNYSATCNVNVYQNGSSVQIGTITHSISVMYIDNSKIHISSGSLNSYSVHSNYTFTTGGYTLNNTNGSYSSAGGVVEIYNKTTSLYGYYGCLATVTPNSTPSFSFNQM